MLNCYILQENSWRDSERRISSTRSKIDQSPGGTQNLEVKRRRTTLSKFRKQVSEECRTHIELSEKMTSGGDLDYTVGLSASKQSKFIYHLLDLETMKNRQS